MRTIAAAALLLLSACGPSQEAVTCCECLGRCGDARWARAEIVQGEDGSWEMVSENSDPVPVDDETCPYVLEDGRLVSSPQRCWQPGESTPDEFVTCAAECEANYDDLALAAGRI